MEVSQEKEVAEIAHDITTTDVSGRTTVKPLSAAVSEVQDGYPVMEAAQLLVDSINPDDTVIILTGFPIPPTMRQETDGPPGAVSIARAVTGGLDANAVVMCEEATVEICEATATAGELSVVDQETNQVGDDTVTVQPFPTDREEARTYSQNIVSDLDPKAIISVEKVGSNNRGEYHNSSGFNVTDQTAKVEELLNEVDDEVVTIAVGDAGNELGMGKIESTIKDQIQFGDECQCGCGGGIADSTELDLLLPATVSNWGAYGITTCLSQIVDTTLLHEPAVEERMLTQCSLAGAIDGPTEKPNGWVDGLPTDVHHAIVRVLQEVLEPSIHERRGQSSASAK